MKKIQIKSYANDAILFEYECAGNTCGKTLAAAKASKADISGKIESKDQSLVGSFYFDTVN